MAANSDTNQRNPIVKWFSIVIIITMLIHIGYLCYTGCIFTKSQNEVVKEHVNHIAKIDSIFFSMKETILSTDSGVIANAPALLSQLQKDSALFRREVLLSQEEMSNLSELHLNKLGNDYDQIGIWFGVGSVIFLVISFFSMFKIEESKKDAKNVLEDVKRKGNDASDVVDEVQERAAGFAQYLDGIKQNYNAFVEQRSSQLEELERHLSATQSESNEKLNLIKQLLEEVETKNAQYKWSIKAMHEQMQQMEELTNMLREVLKNNGKEATDEQ